jgi:hypothetical protein
VLPRHRGPAWAEGEVRAKQLSEQAILYALSTIAQTCAALAALVGALAIYQINSFRQRHGFVEREIRALARSNSAIAEVLRLARAMAAPGVGEYDLRTRMQAYLAEWDGFDSHYRRSNRLLAIFVGWNLIAILVSLVGFAFVYRLVHNWSSWVILWVVAVCTVIATFVMLLEVRGSLERFRKYRWLRAIFTWLERSEPLLRLPEPRSGQRGSE